MKKLLLKSFLLILMVGTSLTAVLLLPLPYSEPLSLIINKMGILNHTPPPRLIIVGGSGCYNGIDSPLLHKESKLGVVNMGVYAGFGTSPLLRLIQHSIQAGDVILIIPEYAVIERGFVHEETARKWIFAADPFLGLKYYYKDYTGIVRLLNDMSDLAKYKLETLPKSLFRDREKGFVRQKKVINSHGDLLSQNAFKRKSLEQLKERGHIYKFNISNKDVFEMNQFNKIATSIKAKTFFVFPAFPEKEYAANKQEIDLVYQQLRETLQFPVLGTPEDFIYPYENFLDTVNHLDENGKTIRTKKIIELLSKEEPIYYQTDSTQQSIPRPSA